MLTLSILAILSPVFAQNQHLIDNFNVYTNGTSTTFSWVPTSLVKSLNKFQFTLDDNRNGTWNNFHTVDFPANTTNYTVMWLEPYQNYRACFYAYNNTWSSDTLCIKFTLPTEDISSSNIEVYITNTTVAEVFWQLDNRFVMAYLSNSTHNLTYSTNQSYMVFNDLSPNSTYELRVCLDSHLNDTDNHYNDLSVSWRMPSGAPPKPDTPQVIVSPSGLEMWVLLTSVSDVNGYVERYVLQVNSYTDVDGLHVHNNYHILMKRFDGNLTLRMSNYLRLSNITSYQFIMMAQTGFELSSFSNESECVSLGNDTHCVEHPTKTQTNRRHNKGGLVVAITALIMLVGLLISLIVYFAYGVYNYRKTQKRTVVWQPEPINTAVTSFHNPMYYNNESPENFDVDIYEDERQSNDDEIKSDNDLAMSGYIDVEA